MAIVYVLDRYNRSLMPTTSSKAYNLLEKKKAKVIRTTPFVIKMLTNTGRSSQLMTLGIDTGSSFIGSAVIDNRNSIIYMSQVEVRNDIAKKMTRRAGYRRNRRNRKTRYRPARWMNRRNSIRSNRFSPTITSKINSHLKEIKFVKSILPISEMILETATFDVHALKNPAVLKNKFLYQKGTNYGFANTKSSVLNRDNYTCQACKGKSKDKRLHVHHIKFRSHGGSDDETNLTVMCKTCHDLLHAGRLILNKTGKKKDQLKHATQMNSIRVQLLKQLPAAIETFGYITKENRQVLNLSKEHYFDAVVIASQGQVVNFKVNNVLLKKSVTKGDYQQTKGVRSQMKIPTGKIHEFRKFDKVKYLNNEYFIKGRMSTGYAKLMDITGNEITLKPIPKFLLMTRITSRKTCLIQKQIIACEAQFIQRSKETPVFFR